MASESEAEGTLLGPVRVPPDSVQVTDADEEVFLLYTTLAAKQNGNNSDSFRGLGHVDSRKDTLSIEFTLRPEVNVSDPHPEVKGRSGRSNHKKSKAKATETGGSLIVELLQDKTALRSRKGDTGSVLWRASLDFAQYVLQQQYVKARNALLNYNALRHAHVLELGAGTGLLGVVLSPLVARYTMTDIDPLVPLIQKNLALNLPKFSLASRSDTDVYSAPHGSAMEGASPNVITEALDWEVLRGASQSRRRSSFTYPPIDLLLVVDCIYHPSLLPALLSTIEYLTTPNKTAVLVVVELRAEDVIREFLEGWLGSSSDSGEWEIRSVGGILDGPYAIWVGWKKMLTQVP